MKLSSNRWNRLRYGFYAPIYDLVGRHLDRGRRRSIELVGLRPGEKVLIVGAGTGLDFPYIPPDVRIVATDLSPAMVRRAEERATRHGVDATCMVMNAHRLDLPDDTFDAVLLHLVLAVVPDPNAAIREASRVLKPGGRAGIFDKFLPDEGHPSPLRRAANVLTEALFSDINRQLGPLLDEAGLVSEREEPVLYGDFFKVALARKPDPFEPGTPAV